MFRCFMAPAAISLAIKLCFLIPSIAAVPYRVLIFIDVVYNLIENCIKSACSHSWVLPVKCFHKAHYFDYIISEKVRNPSVILFSLQFIQISSKSAFNYKSVLGWHKNKTPIHHSGAYTFGIHAGHPVWPNIYWFSKWGPGTPRGP